MYERLRRRRGSAARTDAEKQARAEGLYEADRGSLIKSSQANPILNALYQKITPEEAHHLLHVHYPGEDAQA